MNEDRIFDEKIKELLYDAEQKAPSSVWKAVSARIQERFNWWPVVGLAFASFAIALILPVLFDSADEHNAVAVSDCGYYSNSPCSSDTFARLEPSSAGKLATNAGSGKVTEPTPGAENVQVTGRTHAAGASQEAGREQAEDAGRDTDRAQAAEMINMDPFRAQDASESRRSHRAAQLTIGGNLSGGEAGNQVAPQRSGGTAGISSSDVFSETGVSTYGLPFTVGLGVQIPLGKKLFITTGLDYSLLTRTYECTMTPAGTAQSIQGRGSSTLHYLGVPVNLGCGIISSKTIDLYAFAGAEAEFCLANRFTFTGSSQNISLKSDAGSPQFSVAAGLGLTFKVAEHVGIYVDPEICYYFPGNQPKSLRTDKPLMFRLGAGLRFSL